MRDTTWRFGNEKDSLYLLILTLVFESLQVSPFKKDLEAISFLGGLKICTPSEILKRIYNPPPKLPTIFTIIFTGACFNSAKTGLYSSLWGKN